MACPGRERSAANGPAIDGGPPLSPLPEALIGVRAPGARRVSPRVWRPAAIRLLGARRPPGARTVTAGWRVMGWAAERHGTNDHRVWNRAPWSARHGRQRLVGQRIRRLVPSAATSVRGADDPGERRSGRQSAANGGEREAGRSTNRRPPSGWPWARG